MNIFNVYKPNYSKIEFYEGKSYVNVGCGSIGFDIGFMNISLKRSYETMKEFNLKLTP